MKVLHVIPSLSPARGGTTTAALAMADAVGGLGVTNEFATTDDDGAAGRLPTDAPARFIPERHYFSRQTAFYQYAPSFRRWFKRGVQTYDLIHIHGLFSYMDVVAGQVCRNVGVPYIVTPHGMANAYGMRHKKFRKQVSFKLFERPLLNHAAVVHLTSTAEAEDFETLNIAARTSLVPLSVELPAAEVSPKLFYSRFPNVIGRPLVAFVGRLDPIKNLESLIDAMARVVTGVPDALLVVCGSGDDDYRKQLENRVQGLGLEPHVLWAGHVGPELKWSVLVAANCFVLPSISESFGLAAIEAAVAGVPCVLSKNVAIANYLSEVGAGLAVSHDADSLSKAIIGVLEGEHTRTAPTCVKEYFSRNRMGRDLVGLYRNALSDRKSPN